MSQKSKSLATPRSSASARTARPSWPLQPVTSVRFGRHGDDVPEHRVVEVGLGDGGLIQRDRPLDGELRVGEVHEGVGPLELQRPVGVHQVGVGGAVLERLEGVAHAARDVDGLRRVERAGEHLAVGLAALAQVHPGAEDRAARDGDELVPGLGVDAAGDAAAVVVGDVVLDDAEVGDAERGTSWRAASSP